MALLFALWKLLVQWQRLRGLVPRRGGSCYGCFILSTLAGECSSFSQEGSPFCPHHPLSCNHDCLRTLTPGIRSPRIWSLVIWHFTAVPWEEGGWSWSLWSFLKPQGHWARKPWSHTCCEPLIFCLPYLLCWVPVLQSSSGEAYHSVAKAWFSINV